MLPQLRSSCWCLQRLRGWIVPWPGCDLSSAALEDSLLFPQSQTDFFFSFERGTRLNSNAIITKDNLEFLIILTPTPRCWDYRCGPSWLVYVVLGIEARALCILAKYSLSPLKDFLMFELFLSYFVLFVLFYCLDLWSFDTVVIF